jgi:acyl-CoA synthetase (AMP-forming)/AMP-acid ligase II
MNLLDAFAKRVAAHPERPAIIDGRGRTTSYGSLDSRACALAAAWRERGLREGDRVLLAMPLNADLYAALAALWRIGAVAVFPEPALGLAGLRHAVAATRPRAFLAAGAYRLLPLLVPALRRASLHLGTRAAVAPDPGLADLLPEAPALISFTSGSTGSPKAIERTHGFLVAQDRALAPLLQSDREEIDLVAFPVFVIANLGAGVTSLLPNWRLAAPAKAKARAIHRQIERQAVTRLLLSPAIAAKLAAVGVPGRVRTIFTGGGPVFPDLIAKLQASAPACDIVAVYGSTEAEPIAHLHARDIGDADWAAMRGGAGLLAGMPTENISVRILDDEILVAGDHVVRGYVDPAHNAATKLQGADGTIWHRTGDGGRFDAHARLWLRGRMEGRIGGLWPFEVEAPARLWPGVRIAALGSRGGTAVLAIEGDPRHAATWRERAAVLGVGIVVVPRIPVDRRHGSKVDRQALLTLLARA